MDSAVIKSRLEALNASLLSKGCRSPDLYVNIAPNEQFRAHVGYYPDQHSRQVWEMLRSDTVEGLFAQIQTMIFAVASLEERQRQEYLKLLAKTVEYGRSAGIDENFINPLELQMKKLSGNIIEHHNVVVQTANHDHEVPGASRFLDGDDLPF